MSVKSYNKLFRFIFYDFKFHFFCILQKYWSKTVETKQRANQYEDALIQDKQQTMLNQDAFNGEGPIRPY